MFAPPIKATPAKAAPQPAPARPDWSRFQIGNANDPPEHEADRAAERAMRMSVHPAGAPVATRPPLAFATAGPVPAHVGGVLGSPGQPLDAASRAYFEPRFARDFSAVRVHTDGPARMSAAALQAHAYTSGRHIVFGESRFAPATTQGRRLIAHELTHIVQQGDAARGTINPPSIQRDAIRKGAPAKSHDFSVELDHGMRGRYLIHFEKPHARDEVLGLLFLDGAVPGGFKLEDQGVDLLGWTWKFTTADGSIDIGTYQKLTPAFQKHLDHELVALTPDETAAYRERRERFQDSRPAYLGGQSVREAFQECRDNKVAERSGMGTNCWGRRAGFVYFIGWDGAEGGRVLEVRTAPQTAEVSRDWEWYLNEGHSLNYAAREEEKWQRQKLIAVIGGFAGAFAGMRGPMAPPAPAATLAGRAAQIGATGAQAYGAWKTALGRELTELDVAIIGAAGILGASAQLLRSKLPFQGSAPSRPSAPQPDAPAPALSGSKDKAFWRDAPRATANPAARLKPGAREITDVNQFGKQKAAAQDVKQAQQAAKAAGETQAVDARARIAVGQNVAPAAQAGGGPRAMAGGGKPPGPARTGQLSAPPSTGSAKPAGKPATQPKPAAKPEEKPAVLAGKSEPTSAGGQPATGNFAREYPLPPAKMPVDQQIAFYRANRYPKDIQQMIDDIPTVGRVKTAQRNQLAAIARAIRARHTQDYNRRVAGGSQEEPFAQSKRVSQNEGERFNQALTGNRTLNLTGRTKSGELVEFDSVRLREHRVLETKMNLSHRTTSGDVEDQMRRQATFADDWDFSEVRWEVYDYDSYLTAKHAYERFFQLNPKLGSRIRLVNPSDAWE